MSAQEAALRSIAEIDPALEFDAALVLALCISIARAALQREACA